MTKTDVAHLSIENPARVWGENTHRGGPALGDVITPRVVHLRGAAAACFQPSRAVALSRS